MINKSIPIPESTDHIDKRLELINKAITEYMNLHNYSTSHMKTNTKRIESPHSQSFYYKDDLIISVKNGFSFNGVSFVIEYEVNNLLEVM